MDGGIWRIVVIVAAVILAILIGCHFAFGLSWWWVVAGPFIAAVLTLSAGMLLFILMWTSSGGH